MYKHFEASDRIFVNREEYLEWMDAALTRCKEKSVILHLRGIGGIGKSSLLNHWNSTIDSTVRLDCQQYTEFYSRLDILAKGAVRVGVNLRRFDILWHIRKRFVEGVEPATEKGRDWAKEVLVAIPFIGSLASIGSAIKAVSDNVAPKLRKRYGEVGQWLQERLGVEYLERLLEILWKEPQHAEFLYLDALLEDINARKNIEQPLLFLFDHSENVDSEDQRWRYSGKKITEMELWYIFISSLKNCVGVIASRLAAPPLSEKKLVIEEKELIELEKESCIELQEKRGITDEALKERIVSVSGGNPFVINAICDMHETEELAINDIESLRAETLDDVRLKTWRRLFSQTKDLLNLVDRAGLLWTFDRNSMNIIAPDMKSDQWERLIRLSFVKVRDNGSLVLHDLARELVRTELGKQLGPLTTEISELLKNASKEEDDPGLIGIALSVKALDSEQDAITEAKSLIRNMIRRGLYKEALLILENTHFNTIIGNSEIQGLLGIAYQELNRYAEAEVFLREALGIIEESASSESKHYYESIGEYSSGLGYVLVETLRYSEAENWLLKAVKNFRILAKSKAEEHLYLLSECLQGIAFFYYRSQDAAKGVSYALESVELARQISDPILLPKALNIAGAVHSNLGRVEDTKRMYREAIDLQRELVKTSENAPLIKTLLAGLLNNFAMSLHEVDEVEKMYEEIFQIREEIFELYPQTMAGSKMRYGWYCSRNYRIQDAEEYLKQALDIYNDLAKENPEGWVFWIEITRYLLAQTYIIGNRVAEAREIVDGLLSSAREISELKEDIMRLNIAGNLSLSGLLLTLTNQQREASAAYEEAVKLLDLIKLDSAEEIMIASASLNNYSVLCYRMKKYDDAKTLLNRVSAWINIFGEYWGGSVAHAIISNNLALILQDEAKFDEAEAAFTDSIDGLND
ncbi:MAG: tetratricopeptide repeat protein, partial [Candidatus Thorarchaeota archaeon]